MDKSERGKPLPREQRSYAVQLEVRNPSATRATVEGYATVTENVFEMWDFFGPYAEVIRQGSFTKTLSEQPQVQLLLNHSGLSMAYTKAGTLRLEEDTQGLHMAADLNTARSDVRDMVAALDDKAVDEMSFAFRVTKQQWSPDYEQRDILEVDMHRGDVSVVNFGANPATSVALRSADVLRIIDGLDTDRLREVSERVAKRMAPDRRALQLLRQVQKRALAPDDAAFLAQMLGMAASIDLIADEMQEDIAEQLGVENPDDESDDVQALRAPLSLYLAEAVRLRDSA